MKPFNLERALAGDPVIDRKGGRVKDFHLFDCDSMHPLYAVSFGEVRNYTRSGAWITDGEEHSRDLFMAPKQVTVYRNIYISLNAEIPYTSHYYTPEKAMLEAEENTHRRYLEVAAPFTYDKE